MIHMKRIYNSWFRRRIWVLYTEHSHFSLCAAARKRDALTIASAIQEKVPVDLLSRYDTESRREVASIVNNILSAYPDGEVYGHDG